MTVLVTSPQWGKAAAGKTLAGARFKRNASEKAADMWVRDDGDVVYTTNENLSDKGFELVVANARSLFKPKSDFRRPVNLERFGDLRPGERFDMPPMFAAKPFRPAGDLRKVSARQYELHGSGVRDSLPAATWVIPYKRAYVPNVRSYLDPSGWHVFNLGPELGYAVLAPYHQGTLVTFRRKMPGAYPLLMARWRHLRTDPLIQRYATKSGAQRALKSFMCKKCRMVKGGRYRGGMVCP
jgi:hypothetical protein